MSLLQKVTSIFGEDALSWKSVIDSASFVKWDDWSEGQKNSDLIIKKIASIADDIVSLSDEYELSVDHVAKNALAYANSDNIPVAYLTLKKLFNDNKIIGDDTIWFDNLPEPTPFGKFLGDYISGQFNPNISVFEEVLTSSLNKNNEEILIRNLIRCFAPNFSAASKLFKKVLAVEGLKQATPNKLISAIVKETKGITLVPDLTLNSLSNFPVDWQIEILSELVLSKLFLTPNSIKKLELKPQDIPQTQSFIKNVELVDDFSTGLEEGEINGELLTEIFTSAGLIKKLNSDFDWSTLTNTDEQIKFKLSSNAVDNLKIFFHFSDFKTFSANVAALIVASMPINSMKEIKHYEKPLYRLLALTEPRVLYFSVRTANGDAQQFLINYIYSKHSPENFKHLAVDAFFSNGFEEFHNIDSLLLVLPFSDQNQRLRAFNKIYEIESASIELLTKSELYQSFYLDQIKKGIIRKYCITDSAFAAYNKLSAIGAEIVELIIKNWVKISKRPSGRYILSQVIRCAPSLSGMVFKNRGIQLGDFEKILLLSDFKNMPAEAQIDIFKLRANRGKLALQIAIDRNIIKKPFLKWVENQSHLKNLVLAHTPNALPNHYASLPELLAASVSRPEKLGLTILQASQAQLIEVLPEALLLLKDKPRVGAALELAVYSGMASLPLFMQLVKRLAPPYTKESLGKRFDDLYVTYELPKRSGGKRLISAPAVVLKTSQRALLKLLYAEGFSDQAMGFVPGRSIKDNAAVHVGKKIVVNADIKGFFPSTEYKLVYSLSRKLCNGSLSPLACRLFSEICCHNGHLATGAPTSPAVSNLIMRGFDKALSGIATKLGVSYTRYADDLTFSGDSATVWMLRPVIKHLRNLGYELDPKKTNIFRKGRRQTVTGAVVNEKVNLARPLRKMLRAAVDHRIKGKEPFFQGKPLTDAALNGYLSYLKMLSPESAEPLLAKLKEVPEWHY